MASGTRTTARGTGSDSALRRFMNRARVVLDLPLATYYILLLSVVTLTGLGLVMVLSASSISFYDGREISSFSLFFKQAGFAAGGFALLFLASRLPSRFFSAAAPILLVAALAFQALPLIPALGASVGGNTGWIRIGPLQAQPVEISKLAMALFLGHFMADPKRDFYRFGHVLPGFAALAAMVAIVLAGKDLGSCMILLAVILATLFVGGLPWRWLTSLVSIAGVLVAVYVVANDNRLGRIEALFARGSGATDADSQFSQHWQTDHGLYALASGGWFGTGLGGSREKWSWLPEAHNDFIFAIIGEELGFFGSLIVLLLFALLAYGCVRLILRSTDRFVQAATGGIFMWFLGQAAVNLLVVTGVLPVIGVPLPFVSYGGSSLISTLLASGILLSFARAEPGAADALRAQGTRLRASLSFFARTPARKK
ncbi:putative lipid II flippase FtsW [Brevibacterium sp. 50QC2O2]|uniref:FtsW/RodA/SpoVE family cell cycle protein n=1 Tax=Brevibacterium TaxID=1696 RepID=UPI00211C80BF|nr:putative lipid II flippase FtsW [Brevibacterium sp. 91QC2O2]MCQ9384170.1 putative lipid II flippase FtsW [Brevibacterium sp. 68QC2CO]MCQ9388352.1 putative lipid II flippase FtsW [Brevibacterium sp. 50QC2O2]